MEVNLRRRPVQIALAVLAALGSVGIYQFVYIGAPLYDEWHCKQNQAPFIEEGEEGSGCLPLNGGSEFLFGRRIWDPLGNRPYFCDGRRGWTVIHRGDDQDCLRDGINMPDGWVAGPARQP